MGVKHEGHRHTKYRMKRFKPIIFFDVSFSVDIYNYIFRLVVHGDVSTVYETDCTHCSCVEQQELWFGLISEELIMSLILFNINCKFAKGNFSIDILKSIGVLNCNPPFSLCDTLVIVFWSDMLCVIFLNI